MYYCTRFVHCALVWGLLGSSSQPIFGRFLALKMQNFLRGALPRTPLGLPAPDPRLGLRPRPRVRRCRRPEAELRLQAKVARCRLSSKKIAMYCTLEEQSPDTRDSRPKLAMAYVTSTQAISEQSSHSLLPITSSPSPTRVDRKVPADRSNEAWCAAPVHVQRLHSWMRGMAVGPR